MKDIAQVLSTLAILSVTGWKTGSPSTIPSRSNTPVLCSDNDDYLNVLKRRLHEYANHESMYLLPSNIRGHPTLDTIRAATPELVDIRQTGSTAEPVNCPDTPPNGLIHSSQLNSTCPWHFIENIDSNRFPEKLWEANCTCTRCLDFFDGLRTENRCKPVYYYTRVLRRYGCAENVYLYKEVLEPVKSGCMCTSKSEYISVPPTADDGHKPDE